MPKTWTIGSDPGCDLVVAAPASARHCRLTIGLGGAVLEDLGTPGGTFVNRVRLTGSVPVTRADTISLGPSVPMPWPGETAPGAPEVLRIGRDPENDFVVDLPIVSGRHARLVWSGKAGEAEIEDVGSANGTGLGSPDRKIARSRVTFRDTVYLGTAPVAVASLLAKVDPAYGRLLTPGLPEMIIGRAPECDRVIEQPSVSGRHARLYTTGKRVMIEDLESANGTYVNGQRIEGPTPLDPGDIVGLGLHMMRLDPGIAPPAPRVARTVAMTIPRLELAPPSLAEPLPEGTGLRLPWMVRLGCLLAQSPLLALLIVGVFGGRAARAPGEVGAVPALLFALGLAATWFGLSNAVIGEVLGSAPMPRKGSPVGLPDAMPARLGLLGGLCVVQSVVLWGIAAGLGGLRGSWPLSIGLLILAALVGAAIGLLIEATSPRRGPRLIALPVAFLMLWLFGGGPGTLSRVVPWAGMLSAASPTRWAFEGLLILESASAGVGGANPGAAGDLAERYFPAETDRMGPTADATALAAMLVGLSASAAFVSRASAAGPSPRGAT